jgi:hypothetical protein
VIVIDTPPAAGYTATVEKASGTSIRVVFNSESTIYRVKATFDGTRITFEVVKEAGPAPTTTLGGE